ncbi:MAG: hypothetical protein QM582_14090 [Micropruina sp.]|uniref:hypothetical protein n=1 Tax=Micropruina sp. TaxID=2737536 RepID=UPI0039E42682
MRGVLMEPRDPLAEAARQLQFAKDQLEQGDWDEAALTIAYAHAQAAIAAAIELRTANVHAAVLALPELVARDYMGRIEADDGGGVAWAGSIRNSIVRGFGG